MAPDEALGEILQECFFIVRLKVENPEHCFFHPLSNDVTMSLNARELGKFLNSIVKLPAYVDLEANLPVGKDQPPDLAALLPSDVTILPDNLEKTASSVAPEKNNIAAEII